MNFKRTSILLPLELHLQISELAKKDRRSFSNLLTVILENYLEQSEANERQST